MPNKLSKFWQELKRRKVTRVITIYAAAAFVILQLVEILAPSLRLPEWTMNFILILLIVGFIITIIVSWIYDLHPDGGIVKTEPAHMLKVEKTSVSSNSWKIASYISFVVIVGLIVFHIFSPGNRPSGGEILDKSVAVLPFADMSPDKDQEYFCDGITEEIINSLTQVEALKVIARTSSFAFKGKNVDIRDIGRKLGVETLVEGSIQKIGNQLRITAQLIKVEDGSHLWSQRFDRELKDIFEIQDEIATSIVENLEVELFGKKTIIDENRQTENIEAYNLYLQGRYFWNRRTKVEIFKSIYLFEEAIKIDSAYALAFSGLAESYIVLGEFSVLSPDDAFPKARLAALKAIEIDQNLAEAHTALAAVKRDYEWDWAGAEEEYLKAIELNPRYPTAHQWYSEFLSIMGRHDEAIERITYAQKLDPLSPIIYSIAGLMIYNNARLYDQALSQSQKALEIDSNYVYAYYALADNYMHLEMYEEATKAARKAVLLSSGRYKSSLAQAYALSGNKNEAIEILNELVANLDDSAGYYSTTNIAQIYLALGMKDQALGYLEKGLPDLNFGLIHLKVDPFYDDLRKESRFIELLKEIGLED
jgi:TolB-like protein/Tfp pilus assembly protein PilF